jgi:hypothetical protein
METPLSKSFVPSLTSSVLEDSNTLPDISIRKMRKRIKTPLIIE